MKADIIYNEDCIGEKGMRILPDGSIDMILADIPYGTTACKWDKIIPLEPMWKQLKRIIKPNGAIVLTASQPFTTKLIASNMKMFRYCWVWVKNTGTGFASVKYVPLKYSEDILVFYKRAPVYNPIPIRRTGIRCRTPVMSGITQVPVQGANALTRMKKQFDPNWKSPSNVIFFDSVPNFKGRLHPTQKPVALFEYLIKTYTNESDLVLDNCMGSGTTAVACVNLNRHYIGFETNPKDCEIAKRRLSAIQLELIK